MVHYSLVVHYTHIRRQRGKKAVLASVGGRFPSLTNAEFRVSGASPSQVLPEPHALRTPRRRSSSTHDNSGWHTDSEVSRSNSFFLRAAPVAYGGSQARGLIGATAAGLHHSHSHARSELSLQPTPHLGSPSRPEPTSAFTLKSC